MGIELYWDNDERTVMLVEVRDTFTWDEMYAILHKIKKVTDSAPQTLGAILDLSAGVRFPGGSLFSPSGLVHAKNMLAMGEGGSGPVVVVGVDGLIRRVYDWFAMVDRQAIAHVRFADTLDQAQKMMETHGYSYAPRPKTDD